MKSGKRQKRIPAWGKVIIIILAVLLVLGGGVFAYAHMQLDKINKVDDKDIDKVNPAAETFEVDENPDAEAVKPEEIQWDNVDVDVMRDKDVVNILLIGQDRRPGEPRQRSDSMIICSINKKTEKIILSSVMRDMYVPIPGYSDNKLNAAYAFGGMPLLDQVIEESLGIHIDGNVEVDFDGFINAMIQVGDLDIDLYEAEVKHLNEGYGWNLQVGVNSLTAEQALAYARIRYVGNSDWERTDRQRRVLMAAFDKVKGQGMTELLGMADKIFPYLTTDMSNTQILGYVYTVVTNGMTEIESYRIPVEGTYSPATLTNGMQVLVPDLSENSKYLQEYIYGGNEGE